jgi:chlorobactene glucosyltransferase
MSIALAIIVRSLWIAALAGLGAYWATVLYHIWRTMRRVPTCRDGLKLERAAGLLGPEAPRVCIVVPAHNEEGVVGRLAASLMRQTYPNLSVVFTLDRCTDATAAEIRARTAGAANIEIVEIRACPPEWAGKVHAVHSAMSKSGAAGAAELLLFTDADTEFDPECVRAAVALLLERELGMLSLMSTLTCEAWFERITQPAAGMELMRQYPLVRANARTHRRAFANGQFMLFTRAAYERMGGHGAVKDAVLEDVALARLAERCAVPGGLMLADNMLRCRMYSDYDEFVRGWKRIYIESANRRVKRLRAIAAQVRLLGTVMPLVALLALGDGIAGYPRTHEALDAAIGAAGATALGLMLVGLAWMYRLSGAPLWCVPFYPIGAWRVGAILTEAAGDLAQGVPVRWGGREYVREAR